MVSACPAPYSDALDVSVKGVIASTTVDVTLQLQFGLRPELRSSPPFPSSSVVCISAHLRHAFARNLGPGRAEIQARDARARFHLAWRLRRRVRGREPWRERERARGGQSKSHVWRGGAQEREHG
eukprot:3823360-Pleurochrysis_carterae.AAC.4